MAKEPVSTQSERANERLSKLVEPGYEVIRSEDVKWFTVTIGLVWATVKLVNN
jgi:hypothetical protein